MTELSHCAASHSEFSHLMKPFFFRHVASVMGMMSLVACSTPDSETKPVGQSALSAEAIREAKSGPVSFVKHVKPVLQDMCDVSQQEVDARPHEP